MRVLILTLCLAWGTWTPRAQADVSLPEKQGCSSCHRFSEQTSSNSKNAPDLFYAGNKYQKPWLEKFLQNPIIIRKAGTSTDPNFLKKVPLPISPHPSLAEEDAKKMTAFLLTLQPIATSGRVDNTPLTKGGRVRTKILFERNFGCIACHEGINLAGKPRGGISGPSLANAGNRLTADWIFDWLKTPSKYLTKGRMPTYKLDDEEAIKLTKYIMTLKIGDWN